MINKKTKTRDLAKIFAIFAGFFFLVGGLLKTVYAASPLFIYMFDRLFNGSNIYFSIELSQITMLEIIALFTLSGLCYSCKRSSALIIPVVSFAFINLYSLVVSFCYDVYATLQLLMGYSMSSALDYSTNIFYVGFALISLFAIAFLILLISVNVSLKKGFVLPLIFAFLTIVTSVLAYLSLCAGDVVQLILNCFDYFAYSGGISFTYIFSWFLFMPFLNNLIQFVFVCGIFFMAVWLIFRPKTIEIKSKKEKIDEKVEKAAKKAEKAAKKAEMLAKKAAEKEAKNKKIEIVAEVNVDEIDADAVAEAVETAYEEAVAEVIETVAEPAV